MDFNKLAALAQMPQTDQDTLLAQLAMLQHHLDDAESYSAMGQQPAAHLSLDDAEEGVERVSQQVLPPAKAEVIEDVAQQGDKEEKEVGAEKVVEDAKAPPMAVEDKEAKALDAFELGLRYNFKRAGIAPDRIEALDHARVLLEG